MGPHDTGAPTLGRRDATWFERPLLDHFFEGAAARHGDKIAIADESIQLSYHELGRACLHLAHRLQALVPLGQPVGLLLPNGALFPVAALGCLAAGRPYIPIDPSYPAMHVEAIISDAGVAALITEKAGETPATGLTSLPIIDVAGSLHAADQPRPAMPWTDGPAAILYTSGSTGRPKGVCYDQRAMMERVASATDGMQMTAQDRAALLSSPVTIAALWLTFTALLNGATLYFIDPRRLGIGKAIRALRDARVTTTFAVPVLLRELLNAPGAKEAFRHLRCVRTGGDVLVARDLELWRSVLPPACGVWITLASTEMPPVFQWTVPPDWAPDGPRLPVGYVRPDIGFLIADDTGAPVAEGEIGELVVKSPHLAVGNWQNGGLKPYPTDPNDQSVRVFHSRDLVRMRSDGLVEMVGRKDRQIKIRGYRVNLADVEAAIRNCPGVAAAAVIARQQDEEVGTLVAYVEPKDRAAGATAAELKVELAKRLPRHMRPGRVHLIDAIPLLPGFKIDGAALAEIDRQQCNKAAAADADPCEKPAKSGDAADAACADAPSVRVSRAIEQAWVTVLDRRSFKADSPFDDAGGDSLTALHMWSLIEHSLDAQLSFDNLQLDMTPTALTAAIEKQLASSHPDRQTGDRGRSGPDLKKRLIFYMPTAEGDTFVQARLRAGFGDNVRFEIIRYPSAVEFLDGAAKFDVLLDAAVAQILAATNDPNEPCNIMGYSFGGFVAWGAACRLAQLGRPIDFIGLIDARRQSDVEMPEGTVTSGRRVLRQFIHEPRETWSRATEKAAALTVRGCSPTLLRYIYRAARLLPAGAAFRTNLLITEKLRIRSGLNWKPMRLDHPAFLFRSNEFLPSRPDFGWRTVCPRLEIIHIGGTHESLLHRPLRDVLCSRVLEKASGLNLVAWLTSASSGVEFLNTMT